MHKEISRFFNIFDIKFKVSLFAILVMYIFGLFFFALRDFRTSDPVPEVKFISINMRKQFRDLSTKIRAGLYIKNFPTFDFTTNNFVVDGVVWFEFNKNEIMLKTVDKFSFENSKMIYKSSPHVSIQHDKILVKYEVIFEVKTDLNFHRFPLEDHRLSIVLTNYFVSPNEMYFDDQIDALSLKISDKLFTSNWLIDSKQVISGYSSLHIDEFNKQRTSRSPKAVFTINFKKAGINKILIIFVPLFAAVLFALFTFLMSFNSYAGKTTLTVTAVTALLGYRFVIQQMSPPVGYFTLTDKLFIFFLILSFLIFIFQLLLMRHYMFLMDREKVKRSEQPEADLVIYPPKTTERVNSIAYFIAVMIFIVLVTYLVLT